MSFFLDYLWIWFVLTAAAGIIGYGIFQNKPTVPALIAALLLPMMTLSLGLSLYYGVDTDRKSLIRVLDAMKAAVLKDDLDGVCRYVSPKALEPRRLLENSMHTITVSKANYHGLTVEVNDAASPPIAKITLTVVFYWQNKISSETSFFLSQPIPETVRVEAEFVKTKDQSWILTDKCKVQPRRLP